MAWSRRKSRHFLFTCYLVGSKLTVLFVTETEH